MAVLTERQRVEIELYSRHNVIDEVSQPVKDFDEPEMTPEERLRMIAKALGAKR